MPFPPAFSRELSLLVLCLRQTPDAAQVEALRQHLSQPLDWTQVAVLAERHRLVPHLYLALKNSVPDLVPQEAWEKTRQRFQANAARNLQFMTELVRVTRSLEQAGIPSMPFKGPALALQLYGGLECRQFHDLDLVVPLHKAVHTAEILSAMGYEGPGTLLPKLTPRQQQRTLARHKDAAFFKSSGPSRILLELHWRLTIAGFDAPIVLSHGTNDRIESNYGTLRALPAVDLTLFLAYHGASHRFFRMSWLADLLQAVESLSPSEYEPLFNQSVAFGCQRHLRLGLAVLSRLQLLREPLREAVETFWRTVRCPELLADPVFQAINAPRDWSQHPLRNYPWLFKLGGWRAGLQGLTCSISPQPDDAIGSGFIHSHWNRWYRVFAKYLTLPGVSKKRPALGSMIDR